MRAHLVHLPQGRPTLWMPSAKEDVLRGREPPPPSDLQKLLTPTRSMSQLLHGQIALGEFMTPHQMYSKFVAIYS